MLEKTLKAELESIRAAAKLNRDDVYEAVKRCLQESAPAKATQSSLEDVGAVVASVEKEMRLMLSELSEDSRGLSDSLHTLKLDVRKGCDAVQQLQQSMIPKELALMIAAELDKRGAHHQVNGAAERAQQETISILEQELARVRTELKNAQLDSEIKTEVNNIEAKTLLLLEERVEQDQADMGEKVHSICLVNALTDMKGKDGQLELLRNEATTLEVENETVRHQAERSQNDAKELVTARQQVSDAVGLTRTLASQLEASENRRDALSREHAAAVAKVATLEAELIQARNDKDRIKAEMTNEHSLLLHRLEAENYALREMLNELTRKYAAWDTDRDSLALLADILGRVSKMKGQSYSLIDLDQDAAEPPEKEADGWYR